jgi:hypothetical protein
MKAYGITRTNAPATAQQVRGAFDAQALKGTAKPPDPPRDVRYLASSRGALIFWSLPENSSDITKWRIYKDTEANFYCEISDVGNRQVSVEMSSGTTPPVTNVFVSSLNAAGFESPKVLVQAKATAETGAPSVPSTPPDTQPDPRDNNCVEVGTPVEVPDGTIETVLPESQWVTLQFGTEKPLAMNPDTLVSVFIPAKQLVRVWWKPWTWKRYWVEAGPNGFFANHYQARREHRESFKVKRICPGGTYRAGEVRVRVHNAKRQS